MRKEKIIFYQDIIFSEDIHALNQRQIVYPRANFFFCGLFINTFNK
jgi:hypothetical protein